MISLINNIKIYYFVIFVIRPNLLKFNKLDLLTLLIFYSQKFK
jgi:hypothetical protein